MSKFRIEISPSKIQRQVNIVLMAVFLISVWSWKEDVLHYQVLIQSLLSLILIIFFFRKVTEKQSTKVASVSEQGDWIWLMSAESTNEQSEHWQLTPESRMTPWWHWVSLLHPISNKSKTHIIFKDSVTDENWRHLSRIIKQRQSQASADSGDKP